MASRWSCGVLACGCSASISDFLILFYDVHRVRNIDGDDLCAAALRMFEPMQDDVADQFVGVHAIGDLTE